RYDRLQAKMQDDPLINQQLGGTTYYATDDKPMVMADASSSQDVQAGGLSSTGARVAGATFVGAIGLGNLGWRSGFGTTALGGPAVEAGRKLAEEIKALKEQQKEHEDWALWMLRNRSNGDRDVEEGIDARIGMNKCKRNYPNSALECFVNPGDFPIPKK
ncbi:MAG: hypothetical protein HQL65_12860, partial [Magnetococcales bacterium]|nr:hypothetical protein [Magnetococcales bacterium]